MFYGVPRALHELAQVQTGVLSASQLLEAGLTRDILRSRVELGQWQRLYRGVYATFSGEPSRGAQLWGAVLRAGPGAMLSYQTAAEVGRLTDQESQLIHVTVPAERRIARTAGIAVHYSAQASRAKHPARLPPQTRIEETVLDLVDAARSLDSAVGWLTAALARRLTNQDRLRAAVESRKKMRWRAELTELLNPDIAGLQSILEYRYHRDVEQRHRLPTASRQVRFRNGNGVGYRDRFYDKYLTVVELDGRLAHPDEKRWNDIRRDNAAAADGITTMRYGWLDVRDNPCRVAAEVALALRARGFTGGRPCSADCPVGAVLLGIDRPSA
jgi:hypothetical protein